MKKTKIIFITAALLSAVSCQESFNVEDTGNFSGSQAANLVEEDPAFLNSYIQGLYSYMVTYGNYNYDGHDNFGFLSCTMVTDFMCHDIVLAGSQNWGWFDYTYQYNGADYVRCYQQWANYFTLINNSNEIINFFETGQDPEDITLRGYLGQAYAMRAMCYTYLLQLFQDPVTSDGQLNTEGLTVPISYAIRDGVDTETANVRSGRNTMATVMEHIEFNIEESLKLLEGYQRATKNEIDYSVAQGIAARYYLLTRQWDKAAAAANAARQGYALMDQTRLKAGFMEIEDAEVMWGFNQTTETQTAYASFFSNMSNDCEGYAGLDQPSKCIDRSLYDQIPNSDYRKSLFNGPDGDPSAEMAGAKRGYASRKFGYDSQWLQDYIYMRAAEMYLIEAESYARLGDGNASSVMADFMAMRDPAWAGGASVDDILLQRRIELWGEGFEFYDLRRNGLGSTRSYEGTNHPAEGQIDVPAHDTRWRYQIPTSELEQNPELAKYPQNEL